MATATREAYGKTLAKLIVEHDDLFVLDADLTKSTKTIEAKKARPEHHFNMGIAEGNMMAVAAGMAASNKVVYASSFAMFAAGRAFEQIRNSICYPNLNVKVCATHAGISVGDDDDKIRLNQRKPSKYKGLRRFGPEKNLQRINKFMKERPIFYKNLIQMKENIRFYLRCFYCITKVMILQFNSENRTELARNG